MNAGTGAVFFLGSRAHYQVLHQPDTRPEDIENANGSTDTIYQNIDALQTHNQTDIGHSNWGYNDNDNLEENNYKNLRSRGKRISSETLLCDDIQPTVLNAVELNQVRESVDTSKSKSGSRTLLAVLGSLTRRKKRLESRQLDSLSCSYRESCRCLDCQSRYFECDESEEEPWSDEDYMPQYIPQYATTPIPSKIEEDRDEDDDEVFIDTVPSDSTSTDMLLEQRQEVKMSTSSDDPLDENGLELEVAAGTPVLLNYLLTHPITCSVQ